MPVNVCCINVLIDDAYQQVPDGHHTLRIGDIPLPGYGLSLTGRVMTDVGKALSTSATEDEFGCAGAAGTFLG